LKVLIAIRPTYLRELGEAHFDWYALAVIVAISIACGLLFALARTVKRGRNHGPSDTLKAGATAASPARNSERLRSLLVVTEMAMSTLLLVGATLLVRTVMNLQRSDLGFAPLHLYQVTLELPNTKYSKGAKDAAIAEVERHLHAVPGVVAVATTNTLPGSRSFTIGALQVQGEALPPAGTTAFIDVNGIGPGYFRAIGARLVEGQPIMDTTSASRQVIINAGFARRHWPTGSAIGHQIRISFQQSAPDWMTIVGVVADIASGGPMEDKSAPVLYVARNESEGPALVMRTNGSPTALAGIMKAVRAFHPELPPTVQSAETIVADSVAAPRFIMLLLATFTVLALVLASIGLYGVMAYTVAQRTREIGIRIALGASAAVIARSVIIRGAVLACVGAAIGLTLAVWGTRIIEGSLFGVSRLDTTSFVAGALVLIVSAVFACVAPMRRAVGVDPITAIRAD
jgi:putative ABC transport system permease protein